MRIINKTLVLALVCVHVMLLNGCGGGGGASLPISGTDTISSSDSASTNGAHYDLREVLVSAGSTVSVSMNSSQVNPYVEVFIMTNFGNGEIIRTDIKSSSSGCLSFNSTNGGKYSIKFSTNSADQFGSYTYSVSQTGGSSGIIMMTEPEVSTEALKLSR